MKKTVLLIFSALSVLTVSAQQLTPLMQRVGVQDEVAPTSSVIGGEWVAVGSRKPHAISLDPTIPFNGKPSYRFELRQEDNTLSGYNEGDTKGRAELCYCYATAEHLKGMTFDRLEQLVRAKKVYHYGKGACPQGSTRYYRFSIYVPSTLSPEVNTIFAQWHGMPDRTLVQTPEGVVKQITDAEFSALWERMVFKKDTGYDKIFDKDADGKPVLDKDGQPKFKLSKKPNGWLVEQGGYPPLAFGFAKGMFNIKANSDRKYMSDKTDRCNIDAEKASIMQVNRSKFKSSTLAYKSDFASFPKNQWVTFDIKVKWSSYNGEKEQETSVGELDVKMNYNKNGKPVTDHIVKNETLSIGRNDESGYYFKFGIYRVGNSTEPVLYNLAGYKESDRSMEK